MAEIVYLKIADPHCGIIKNLLGPQDQILQMDRMVPAEGTSDRLINTTTELLRNSQSDVGRIFEENNYTNWSIAHRLEYENGMPVHVLSLIVDDESIATMLRLVV